jgi:ketosteroid isomerase-like protein
MIVDHEPKEHKMPKTTPKQLARRAFEALSAGDAGAIETVFAPQFTYAPSGRRPVKAQPRDVGQIVSEIKQQVPDFRYAITELKPVRSDAVFVKWTAGSPNGRQVNGKSLIRVADGKIVEQESTVGYGAIASELGVELGGESPLIQGKKA